MKLNWAVWLSGSDVQIPIVFKLINIMDAEMRFLIVQPCMNGISKFRSTTVLNFMINYILTKCKFFISESNWRFREGLGRHLQRWSLRSIGV